MLRALGRVDYKVENTGKRKRQNWGNLEDMVRIHRRFERGHDFVDQGRGWKRVRMHLGWKTTTNSTQQTASSWEVPLRLYHLFSVIMAFFGWSCCFCTVCHFRKKQKRVERLSSRLSRIYCILENFYAKARVVGFRTIADFDYSHVCNIYCEKAWQRRLTWQREYSSVVRLIAYRNFLIHAKRALFSKCITKNSSKTYLQVSRKPHRPAVARAEACAWECSDRGNDPSDQTAVPVLDVHA